MRVAEAVQEACFCIVDYGEGGREGVLQSLRAIDLRAIVAKVTDTPTVGATPPEEPTCPTCEDAECAFHPTTQWSKPSLNTPQPELAATEAQLDATLRDAGVAAAARAKGYDEGLEAAAVLVEEGAGTPVGADLHLVRSDEFAAKLRAKKVGA